MKKIYALLGLILVVNVYATPQAYFEHDGGFFSSDVLKIGGKEFTSAAGFYDFVDAVKSDPIAKKYAEKHRSYGRWANGIMWGSLAVAITYLFMTTTDDMDEKYGIYFGTAFGGIFTGIVLFQKSRTYLHKSINHFNGLRDRKDKRMVFARYNIKF